MSIPVPVILAASCALLGLGACAEKPRTAANAPFAASAPEAVAGAQTPIAGIDDRNRAVTIATWRRTTSASGVVGSAAAMAGGTLIVRRHCLMVETPNGRTILPVFPGDRVVWDAARGTLTHEGRRYRPGDPIRIGGGGVAKTSPAVAPIADIVARCAPDIVWVVGG